MQNSPLPNFSLLFSKAEGSHSKVLVTQWGFSSLVLLKLNYSNPELSYVHFPNAYNECIPLHAPCFPSFWSLSAPITVILVALSIKRFSTTGVSTSPRWASVASFPQHLDTLIVFYLDTDPSKTNRSPSEGIYINARIKNTASLQRAKSSKDNISLRLQQWELQAQYEDKMLLSHGQSLTENRNKQRQTAESQGVTEIERILKILFEPPEPTQSEVDSPKDTPTVTPINHFSFIA